MSARFLVRFDDICPTMNWPVWEKIELLLRQHDVCPIVSVVPDNLDPKLCVEEANPHFWERVRAWQALGWTIGLHGHQHLYESSSAGIVGIKAASEFAGVTRERQKDKLAKAIAIFQQQSVVPEVWVAPGHSFDWVTVELLSAMGVRYISDGLFFSPRMDDQGVMWVPQQLWRFRRMPFGLWTICVHHNSWNDSRLSLFRESIKAYRADLIAFHEAVVSDKPRTAGVGGLIPSALRQLIRFRSVLQR